eukprot:TRINITY_DN10631_c0_g1_i1.p1 TRINITY_DN10631_c0_g1~~TRINITY_DN10631_c0_g1_i1.p1  ORF type:complete len:281 (+),score=60.91 TRINITY_DN10631_c0_g1_i1:187-1029(+)
MFHAEVSTPSKNHIFCSSSVFSSNPQNLLPSSDPIFVPLEELIDYTSFADDYPELYEVQNSISRAASTSEEEKQVAQSNSNNTVTTLECSDGDSAYSCESPFDFDSLEEASLGPSVSEIPSTPESILSSPASPIAAAVPTPTNLLPVPCYTSYQLCSGPLAKLDFGKPIAFTLHPAIPIPVTSSTSAQISEAKTVIGNGNYGAAAIDLPISNFKKPRSRAQASSVILKSNEKTDNFVARPRQKQVRKSIVANQRRRDDKGKFIKEDKKLSVKNIESAMVM